jgi:hypothetical protein
MTYSPDAFRVKAASRRCTELLVRTFLSQATVGAALDVPNVIGALKDKVLQDHLTGTSGVMDSLLNYNLLIGFKAEDFPFIARGLAEQAAVNTEKVISAAAVILSHSTADDVFTEACKVAIDLDRDKWIPLISPDRTVSLKSLKDKGADVIFAEELESFKNGLGNKSLPKRADILFERVHISHNPIIPSNDERHFTMTKLKEADDLRHDLVHRNGLPKIDPARGAPVMAFLHEAAQTVLRSVANTYGLSLDQEYIKSLIPPSLLP